MKSESAAIIFNSFQRVIEKTGSSRSFNILNSKDVSNESRQWMGQLRFFKEVHLAPLENIIYDHEENTYVIILPLTGGLTCQVLPQEELVVTSEQALIHKIEKEKSYIIYNSFKEAEIRYLHIGFQIDFASIKRSFVLENIALKKMNELVCIDLHAPDQFTGYIGMYQGRNEDHYKLKKTNNAVFVYVINGAFEVQGRLLEHQDGLILKDTKEIEFEALSNNAIIMLLEIKLNNY